MLTLRCTHALLDRMKLSGDDAAGRSTTALGDWYGHMVRLGRRRAILLVSERSRLPVLLPPGEAGRLTIALPAEVSVILSLVGADPCAIEREVAQMREVHIGRTASRSVLGSINEFAYLVRVSHELSGNQTLRDLALDLCGTPVLPLGGLSPALLTRQYLAGA